MYQPNRVRVSIRVISKARASIAHTGIGIPSQKPCPRNATVPENPAIGTPPVMACTRPRAIERLARVTMNGGTENFAISSPLNSPTAAPAASAPRMTTVEDWPWAPSQAPVTPARPITDPTERSIPAVRMTSDAPIAAMATKAKLRDTSVRFEVLRNSLVVKVSATQTRISEIAAPASGR
jgi:hypothetical protein